MTYAKKRGYLIEGTTHKMFLYTYERSVQKVPRFYY